MPRTLTVNGAVIAGAEVLHYPEPGVTSKRLVANPPYANGQWDVSTSFSNGNPVFNVKTQRWLVREYTHNPETLWSQRQAQWSGRILQVSLPGHEDGYFEGSVELVPASKMFKPYQLDYWLTMQAFPWYLNKELTSVKVTATSAGATYTLTPTNFTVDPQVTTTAAVTIQIGARSWAVPVVSGRELPNLVLEPEKPLVGTVKGSGIVTFAWRGGRLS